MAGEDKRKAAPAGTARASGRAKTEKGPAPVKEVGSGGGPAAPTPPPAAASRKQVESPVNPLRVRPSPGTLPAFNPAAPPPAGRPVIYWMSREQRVADNWALLYAAQQAAAAGAPLAVAFNLVPAFLGAGARQFGFMLRGLEAVAADLAAAGIPFFLLRGDPGETLPALAARTSAGLVVADVSPLRLSRSWRASVAAGLGAGGTGMAEVDAHNVVPLWGPATEKKEIGARTLRPRLHRCLPDFLTEFPALPPVTPWAGPPPPPIDWAAVITEATAAGAAVPEVAWCVPGEAAARAALAAFATRDRLKAYLKRNDPNVDGLSNLSPYFHFGQLAPQRAALAVDAVRHLNREAADSFLEEAIIRRELSDNFCWHEPAYDSLDGAAPWARESLELHASDPREHTYTRDQLEAGATHDELWNASQSELVSLGKMHGFMRMYWAKKILEWTPGGAGPDGNGPAYALATAIYLNDKYELDGRDPNGYVGCMWAIAGTHDMGWAERAVFGKIRYMNYAGCKRKFDIGGYVGKVRRAVAAEAARRGA